MQGTLIGLTPGDVGAPLPGHNGVGASDPLDLVGPPSLLPQTGPGLGGQ